MEWNETIKHGMEWNNKTWNGMIYRYHLVIDIVRIDCKVLDSFNVSHIIVGQLLRH